MDISKFFKVLIVCQLVLLQISRSLSLGCDPTVDINSAPFLVQILYKGNFVCAGTLVSNRVVVTSGNCVIGFSRNHFTVKGGASTLSDAGIKSKVNKIRIHEQYSNTAFDVDVAVIELKNPIKGDLVKPIALCDGISSAGDDGKLYGWGNIRNTTSTGRILSNQLQSVSLELIGKTACKEAYDNTMEITDNMLCAAATEKVCSNNYSGSPVIINGQYCGIVPRFLGHTNVPDVLTDVSKVREFIARSY